MGTIDERYLFDQGIDEYIHFEQSDEEVGVYEVVKDDRSEPLPPQPDDLARMHRLSRDRGVMTVLEFGIGYSSIVFADALAKNQAAWQALEERPEIRNENMFELHVVDASPHWLSYWDDRFPAELREYVEFHQSDVHVTTHRGKMCHVYERLPDVIPDFVYLDAPNPKQVEGTHRGMSFHCLERTVMAADLLDIEPTLLPGTYVLVDGRTNNARFLNRYFERDFSYDERPDEDVSVFELDEPPLGKYNRWWPLANCEDVSLAE